jgi:hypothetical protein
MRAIVYLSIVTIALASPMGANRVPLSDLSQIEFKNGTGEVTTYHGSAALKMTGIKNTQGGALAILKKARFRNGVIDVDVSGAPAKDADADARGFIGVAFRVQSAARFEIIYLRPTNARSDDQSRRNHTTQYSSEPDWPWDRLRKESPGIYESYVDMLPGEWTHMRIVVQGTDASLYVGKAEQPCLIVHDLKLGEIEGQVALWMGGDTEGYFRNLNISEK